MSSYFEKLPYNQKKALSDLVMVVCSKIDRTIFNNKEKLYDFLYDVRYNYDCALDAQSDEEDAIYQAAREHGKEYQQLVEYLAMMFENFPGLYHDIDCILDLFYTALKSFQ